MTDIQRDQVIYDLLRRRYSYAKIARAVEGRCVLLSPRQRRSSGRASGKRLGSRTYLDCQLGHPGDHPAQPPCVVAELASRAIPDEVGAGDADQDVDHQPAALRNQLVNGNRNLTSCRRIPLFIALPQANPQHQEEEICGFCHRLCGV